MLPNPTPRLCALEVTPMCTSSSKSNSRVVLPSFSSSGNDTVPSLPSASTSTSPSTSTRFALPSQGCQSSPRDGDSHHPGHSPKKKSHLLPYLDNAHTGSSLGMSESNDNTHLDRERRHEGVDPSSSSRRHFPLSSLSRQNSKDVNSFPLHNNQKIGKYMGGKHSSNPHYGDDYFSRDGDGTATNATSMVLSLGGSSQRFPDPIKSETPESASFRLNSTILSLPTDRQNSSSMTHENHHSSVRNVRCPSRHHKSSAEGNSFHGNSALHGSLSPPKELSSATSATQKHPPHHLTSEALRQSSIPRLEKALAFSVTGGPTVELHNLNSNSIGSVTNISSTIRSAKEALRKRALPHTGPMRSSSFYKSSTSSTAANRKKTVESRPSVTLGFGSDGNNSGTVTVQTSRSTGIDSDFPGSNGSESEHVTCMRGSDVAPLVSHRSGVAGSMTSFLYPDNASVEESPLDFCALENRSSKPQQPHLSAVLTSTVSPNTISNNNVLVEMFETSLCHDTMLSPRGGAADSRTLRQQLTPGIIAGASFSGPGGILSFTPRNQSRRGDDSMEDVGSDSDVDSDELVHRHQERIHMRMQCLTQRNSEESHLARTIHNSESPSHQSERDFIGDSDSRSYTAFGAAAGSGPDVSGNYFFSLNETEQNTNSDGSTPGGCGSSRRTTNVSRLVSTNASKKRESKGPDSSMQPPFEDEKNGEVADGGDNLASSHGLAVFVERYASTSGELNRRSPLSKENNNAHFSPHQNEGPNSNGNGFAAFEGLFLPLESSPSRERDTWHGFGVEECSADDWYARMRKQMTEESESDGHMEEKEKSEGEENDDAFSDRECTLKNKDEALHFINSSSGTIDYSSMIHTKCSTTQEEVPPQGEESNCTPETPPKSEPSGNETTAYLKLPLIGKDSSFSVSKELIAHPPTTEKPSHLPHRDSHFSQKRNT